MIFFLLQVWEAIPLFLSFFLLFVAPNLCDYWDTWFHAVITVFKCDVFQQGKQFSLLHNAASPLMPDKGILAISSFMGSCIMEGRKCRSVDKKVYIYLH